ncbi:phage late control D family protein [Shinella sp. HZN7]|uniref:phage late control D family protein n=1 Tax=Shinella sp. (strain HZN7) TaxID=879274 RepID=UPI0007DA508F|nr:contractile injection system protein, VgrG/Pvc8 family [Shinella sp. HZN7]ANH04980.1 late control protein D [Shinella sp. HZN7]
MALKPSFALIYQGTDISSELDPLTTSITYTDNHHGKVDEIDVTVQDKDGRWKGSWKPEAGDTMELTIHDGAGGILPCGIFEMDEPDASGSRSGDTMTIRGLAAPITKPLRTEKTRAFEKQTLRQIVQKVAGETGLSIEGDIEDLRFERVTQRRERDLEFLTRLAQDTGHYFSARGNRAVFTSFRSIDGQAAALAISHNQLGKTLLDYRIRDQAADTYSKAKVTALDEEEKEKIEAEEEDSEVKTGDTLRIAGERVENMAQAKALAKSRLHFKNRKKRSGSISVVGNVRLLAGVIVDLVDFGKYSGPLLVDRSSHAMTRGGYTSSAELLSAKR